MARGEAQSPGESRVVAGTGCSASPGHRLWRLQLSRVLGIALVGSAAPRAVCPVDREETTKPEISTCGCRMVEAIFCEVLQCLCRARKILVCLPPSSWSQRAGHLHST